MILNMDVFKIKELQTLCKGRRQQIEYDLSNSKNRKTYLENRMGIIEQAQVFLQKIAQETQSKLKFQIEDIVNLALDACFPDEYEFRLNFNIARGKTDAELVFISKKTGREIDPMGSVGGGVVDLTSFALRMSMFMLEREVDNVMILDEPFRFVSKDLQSRAGEILRKLSSRLGIQIILVTHIDNLIDVADRVFEVRKGFDGVSKIICK